MLLPVVVIACAVLVFVLFFEIYSYIEYTCAARYGLDFIICPAPWAPVVFPAIFCVGSIIGGAFCVAAAYRVAPTAQCRAVRITVIVVACFTLCLSLLYRRWELLFALAAAFAVEFLVRRRDLRFPPNT
jgi:hypothetical protein